jgi:hypothetical protein
VSAGFARQAAHVLAGKLLLLRTFERLEEGLHVELAIALLRVWLDFTATLLDEFTIRVHECLPPSLIRGDRPLVEFGSGPPPRTLGEYLAAPSPYSSGDFLLAPLDLLQPRLVPEMLRDAEEIASLASAGWCFSRKKTDISDPPQESMNTIAEELVHAARGRGDACFFLPWREEILFLIEALALETLGRRSHPHTRSLDLELACARLLIADLHQRGGGLRDRCIILRKLADEIIPRWLRGGVETRVRHLGREVLELEALKEDLRRRMAAAWQTFGTALGHNADVQASCFALAEAVAWLKAADSTLARMAWFTRMSEAEERDEPADRQVLGRRVLTHCYAEVRDRLFRFEEDLASLRRGYYAPHVRAATLLLMPRPPRTPPPPQSRIERPLRVLVVVEPLPAIVHQPTAGDARVMESYWTLDEADRSALENALRLRDVAEDRVHIEVAAIGPPRVAQALREILSLNIESVRLFVPDRENGTVERAARALAAALESTRPFDLILGAVHETRLTAQVAETLGLPVIGHALEVEVQADADGTCIRLHNAGAHPPRERPLPAAVLIEAGTPLRPFTIAGYVDGLTRAVQTVTT